MAGHGGVWDMVYHCGDIMYLDGGMVDLDGGMVDPDGGMGDPDGDMVDIDGDMVNQEISCDGKEILYYFQDLKLCSSSSGFGFLCVPYLRALPM
jgi:hypothetical protein